MPHKSKKRHERKQKQQYNASKLGFYKPLTEKSYLSRIFNLLPKIELLADGFTFNGLPYRMAHIPSNLRNKLNSVLALGMLASAKAEEYQKRIFSDPLKLAEYILQIQKDYSNLFSVLGSCNATELTGSSAISFDSIQSFYTAKGWGMTNGGPISHVVATFFRGHNQTAQVIFENCIKNSILEAGKENNNSELGIIVASIMGGLAACCLSCCAIMKTRDYCRSKTIKKITEDSGPIVVSIKTSGVSAPIISSEKDYGSTPA